MDLNQTLAESMLMNLMEERSAIATTLGTMTSNLSTTSEMVTEINANVKTLVTQGTDHEHRIAALERAALSRRERAAFIITTLLAGSGAIAAIVLHFLGG